MTETPKPGPTPQRCLACHLSKYACDLLVKSTPLGIKPGSRDPWRCCGNCRHYDADLGGRRSRRQPRPEPPTIRPWPIPQRPPEPVPRAFLVWSSSTPENPKEPPT